MWPLLVAGSQAADSCIACCRAGGLPGCEAEIRVMSEGSAVAAGPGGFVVTGHWAIGCDGRARYDPGGVVTLDHSPLYGELIMSALNPLQVHCFDQACALPAGTCIAAAPETGTFTLVDCDDGLTVDARSLARESGPRPGADALVVVVDGKPLVAEPAGVQPTTARPVSAPAPRAAAFEIDLPPDPPDACSPPPDALRNEARRRVDMGDERRMAKDPPGSAREYRAALTMDACNGYAWLGLGEAAANLGRPDVAIRSLKNATHLLPKHYGAWVLLGKGYEAIGQRVLAAAAYKAALALSPGLPDAVEGYARTR